jgi:hypothetical protein
MRILKYLAKKLGRVSSKPGSEPIDEESRRMIKLDIKKHIRGGYFQI